MRIIDGIGAELKADRGDPGLFRAPRSIAQVVGLIIALGGSALVIWLRTSGLAGSTIFGQRAMSTAAMWAIAAVILLWVVVAEQRPLASLGFRRPTLRSLIWGLAAAILGFLIATAAGWLIMGVAQPAGGPPPENLGLLPDWMRALMVLSSGFLEETLLIAYPLTRLASLTGSRWIALALTLVVFVALHIPSRPALELIPVVLIGALMAGLLLWRRDLWSNVIGHCAIDFLPILILPILARAHG